MSIILVGLQYRFVNPDFVDTIWKYFSALITASTVWGTFVSMLGITAFNSPSYPIIGTVKRFKLVRRFVVYFYDVLFFSWYYWNDCWNK
jgi:hypothetical protein